MKLWEVIENGNTGIVSNKNIQHLTRWSLELFIIIIIISPTIKSHHSNLNRRVVLNARHNQLISEWARIENQHYEICKKCYLGLIWYVIRTRKLPYLNWFVECVVKIRTVSRDKKMWHFKYISSKIQCNRRKLFFSSRASLESTDISGVSWKDVTEATRHIQMASIEPNTLQI